MKKTISIIVLIIGIIMLGVGTTFLILDLVKKPLVQDGDYLVSMETWQLSDGTNCGPASEIPEIPTETTETTEATETPEAVETPEAPAETPAPESNGATNCIPSVIWRFTEIGKGTLTTNGHINDYDFIWAIEGNKLRIETSWLYPLENEFTYTLNQNDGVLVLTDENDSYTFVAQQ